MGIVLVLIGQAIRQDVVTTNSKCGVGPVSNSTTLHCRLSNSTSSQPWQQEDAMDFTYPLLLYLVVGALALLVMAFLFRPKYKRLEMERRAALLAKLQDDDVTPSSSVTSLPTSADKETAGHIRMAASKEKTHQTSTEF